MFVGIGAEADFAPGETQPHRVGDYDVLVIRVDDEFFAVENRCSHADSPMAGGRVRRGRISCPLHGQQFDLRSGAPVAGTLTRKCLKIFATRLVDGSVQISSVPNEENI